MTKNEFIRLLANRAGLNLEDAHYVWAEVENIFEECVEAHEPLRLSGIGHLEFIKIAPRKAHNIVTNTVEDLPETLRLNFKLSRNLKDLLLPEKKRKINLIRQSEQRKRDRDLLAGNKE